MRTFTFSGSFQIGMEDESSTGQSKENLEARIASELTRILGAGYVIVNVEESSLMNGTKFSIQNGAVPVQKVQKKVD